jgi:hypothetical protein
MGRVYQVLAFPLIVGGDVNGVDVSPVMPMNLEELDMIPRGKVWAYSSATPLVN